jgi:RNA polymerase sigma factor (sigma-70 family)
MKDKEKQLTKAQRKLVNDNLGLIYLVRDRCSRSFSNWSTFDRDDKFQAGFFGLRRAAQKYDPAKINPKTGNPYKFSTYAYRWIFQSMMRGSISDGFRVMRVSDCAVQTKHERRSDEAKDALQEPIDYDSVCLSLRDDNHAAIRNIEREEKEREVAIGMERLSWREKMILKYRFGFLPLGGKIGKEITLKRLGKRFGLSLERIRQLQYNAMRKMKRACYNYSEV